METKFTPGPWRVEHGGRTIAIYALKKARLANVLLPYSCALRVANARLIAAAPDLLAALEGLNDGGCYGACKYYGLGEKRHSAACDAARAALAKVKA